MSDNDRLVLKYLYKFRFLGTSQIEELIKLSGQKMHIRALQRRLKKLYNENVIDRNRNIVYKEYVYNLDDFGYQYFNEAVKRYVKFDGRNLKHELLVVDTLIYLCKFRDYKFESYMTEEDLMNDDIEIIEEESIFDNSIDKIGQIKKYHLGDIVFDNQIVIEVELSRKRKSKLFENLQQNQKNYQKQIWVIYEDDKYIENVIKQFDNEIEIIYVEEIINSLNRNSFYS